MTHPLMTNIPKVQAPLVKNAWRIYENKATMKQADYIRLTAQIAVLKEIAVDYSGKTIDNIIQKLEAIKKEVEHD